MGNKHSSKKKAYEKHFSKEGSIDEYEVLRTIGHGSFGEVFQVLRKDNGTMYAMKVLDKRQIEDVNAVAQTCNEEALQRTAGEHQFIVNLRYAFQDSRKLFIVLDYIPGGDLFSLIQTQRKFSESRARLYAAEVFLALDFLHSMDIIYRDLKLENILLDMGGHARLTDFGLAKNVLGGSNAFTCTFCGTKEYMAPEIVRDDGGYSFAVDWWTFGIFLYTMICGDYPFSNENRAQLFEDILHAPVRFPDTFSAEAVRLVSELLTKKAAKRPERTWISECQFFASLSWRKVASKGYVPAYIPTNAGKFTASESILDQHKRSDLNDYEGFDFNASLDSRSIPKVKLERTPVKDERTTAEIFAERSPQQAAFPGGSSSYTSENEQTPKDGGRTGSNLLKPRTSSRGRSLSPRTARKPKKTAKKRRSSHVTPPSGPLSAAPSTPIVKMNTLPEKVNVPGKMQRVPSVVAPPRVEASSTPNTYYSYSDGEESRSFNFSATSDGGTADSRNKSASRNVKSKDYSYYSD